MEIVHKLGKQNRFEIVMVVGTLPNCFYSFKPGRSFRSPPRQQDNSKVEFSASTFFLKTAGGSPPNDVCGRSSL